MIDMNALFSQALTAAVAEAIKPLAARVDELDARVTSVVEQLANRLWSADQATLEQRLTALATLEARLAALEAAPNALSAAAFVTYLDQQEWFWEKLSRFVAENGNITVDDLHGFKQRLADAEDRLDKITTASDERVQEIVEQAIEDHCQTYDHDEYDSMYQEWGGESTSEFVRDDDLRGVVEEVMNNASFEVTVRL